jgi:ubiquitin C-terminal hydrolase
MVLNKKSSGSLNTKKLMARIKKLNALFDNDDHHDSHEFLSWLLNEIHENVIADAKELGVNAPKTSFITELFEGKLVNSTKCLSCESGGRREETFLALSLDIEKNTSLSNCIRMFSHKEFMIKRDKFFCETCLTK